MLLPDREVLRKTAIFRSLSDADFDALLQCLRVQQKPADAVIFHQGAPGDSMLMVATGTLVALVANASGKDQEINRMGRYETTGEMAFLDPAPRSATVRAATAVTYYELDNDGLATLRRLAPNAAAALVWAVLRDVTRRLRRLDRLIQHEVSRRNLAPSAARRRASV